MFHELIASQPPLTASEASDIDALARLRCQCLMSVDDSYAQIYQTLEDLGIADNTYWVISSDHGYNLGQQCVGVVVPPSKGTGGRVRRERAAGSHVVRA